MAKKNLAVLITFLKNLLLKLLVYVIKKLWLLEVTRIEIFMLLFDTVAKASVLQIKGHAGYYSCSKCTAEGEHINGRKCFPETNFTKRTNEDFR